MEDTNKIDTQGMSGPSDPNYDRKKDKTVYKPAKVTPRRLFTPEFAKAMKILINEVLDERDGKTGISYFDTEHFTHTVIDEEPPYQPYQ